ncbi:MAG TPA: hypothetical protein VF624_03410 [Tepidisphaeraceae bacterium]
MDPAIESRWQTIRDTPLGPADAVVAFEDKLVGETGWTRRHAERAVLEYRRYLLLATLDAKGVSPSPDIDRVWHLHLLYTRDYWQHWCPNVLGFPLHHGPATGTNDNRAALDDAYARTLAGYQALFGSAPPSDLWPAKPMAAKSITVDPARVVVLPRGVWRAGLIGVGLLFAALIAAAYLAVH